MNGRVHLRRASAMLALAAILALAAPPAPAAAAPQRSSPSDAVITWNLNAQRAIWDVAQQQPWEQGRSFSMVQGAVYDAVNAIAGTPYEPYLVAPKATGRESAEAAVAAAAHRVLVALFPAQEPALRTGYDSYLRGIADGRAKRAGVAVGERAAAAMVAARQDDGAFGDQTWPVGTQPGQWRPVPPSFGSAGAWVGDVRPFAIPSASRYRTSGPPALDSAAYARDVNEVQAIGSASSTQRTPDQTDSAIWWHDRRLPQWEINRQLAVNQRLDLLQAARMLAMVNIAAADANIVCFNEKRTWNFWRPLSAIRLADTDGNPQTVADPSWTPLLVTSPNPDYTSGHACVTGATMATLAYLFGRDDIAFSGFSVASGTTRHFRGFSHALLEVIEARIWGGIHFRSADVQGAKIGLQVSAYVITHEFRRQR
jgi:hypothetical protein